MSYFIIILKTGGGGIDKRTATKIYKRERWGRERGSNMDGGIMRRQLAITLKGDQKQSNIEQYDEVMIRQAVKTRIP